MRIARALAPLAAAMAVMLVPPPGGIAPHAWHFLAIFVAVVVGLVLEVLPSAAIGFIGTASVAALAPWTLFSPQELATPGFSAPRQAIDWALSGFSNSTVWLAFSAFMFGTAYERTGLGRRIALILVKMMGRTTLLLGYAVMMSDLILAPFTPSNTARSAGMIFPIIRSLPPLYGSKPHDPSAKRIGGYILWTGFATSCVTSSLFLTALAPNLLAVDMIRRIGGVEISWFEWFVAFAPAGVPLLLGLPVITYLLYPPALKRSTAAPVWAQQELVRMGPVTAREYAVAGLALTAILLWILAADFINPATVALAIVAMMVVGRVVTWDDLMANRDAWQALTLLATLVTLSGGLERTGLVTWLATTASVGMQGISPTLTVIGFVLIYFFSHYLFASLTAHAAAMLPILLGVGATMPGVSFEKLALLLALTQGLMGVLTPYATGPAPVYANSGYITSGDYWRLGTIFGAIFLFALLGLSAPFIL